MVLSIAPPVLFARAQWAFDASIELLQPGECRYRQLT